jgi:hypothetical protein
LHYNYYRTYDPATGRYLESDPIGLAAGLNTYAYVGNMPTTYVDPYGLEAVPAPIPGPFIIPPVAIPGTPENDSFVDAVNGLINGLPSSDGACAPYQLICLTGPAFNEGVDAGESCPVPDTERERITKGKTDIRTKPGDADTANDDFDNLNPDNVSDKGDGIRAGTLPNGSTVVVRPSRDGRPTIEIQRGGRTRIEIRYGKK